MACSGPARMPITREPLFCTSRFARGKGKFHAVEYRDPAEMPDENYPYFLTTGRMFAHFHTGTMTRISPHLDVEQTHRLCEHQSRRTPGRWR